MKNIFRNALVTVGSFIFVISIVSAWTGPTGNPPANNVEAPINVSLNAQFKSGGLAVGALKSLGAVQIGNTNMACDANLQGSARWTGSVMQYCNGVAWVAIPKMFSGIATVVYTNGQPHSSVANVSFPAVCNNPVVVAMPGKNASSIACDDGASKVGICANGKTSASQDLNADVYTITPNGFQTSLSGESGVCVGAAGVLGRPCAGVSPAYEISWIAMCN